MNELVVQYPHNSSAAIDGGHFNLSSKGAPWKTKGIKQRSASYMVASSLMELRNADHNASDELAD
eukprot:scaffold135455_cov23-Prasinocladus_malaysianus.AAC.1